jgi:mannose-6-phosphate isomerase-like protein (cupin superfamily)
MKTTSIAFITGLTAFCFLPAGIPVSDCGALHAETSLFAIDETKRDRQGRVQYTDILTADDFATDLLFVRKGVLPPGSGIGMHCYPHADVLLVALDAPLRFIVDTRAADLPVRAMTLCTAGTCHGLYNPGDTAAEFLEVAVGKEEVFDYDMNIADVEPDKPGIFPWLTLDVSLAKPGGSAHDGHGTIVFRRILNTEVFTTNWYVLSHAILPSGASIGYHRHVTREEVYYVVSGTGRMTVNGVTSDASPGDAQVCPLGGAHGIWNNNDYDLELLVFSASVEKGVVTGEVNLGDDLVGR